MTFREHLKQVPAEQYVLDDIQIRPICDDEDLWYAIVQCQLKPGQEE